MTKLFKILCILAAPFAVMAADSPLAGQAKTADPGGLKPSGTEPSTASQAYRVLTGQSIAETIKNLQSANKTEDLMSGGGIGCRVFVQHEKDAASGVAEVHDATDDIFLIMEGTATLTLGGKLDSPKQTQPGEWRAEGITGGRDFQLRKGDIIVVPRGTPHRRVTPGQEVTLMIIKAFSPKPI